MVIKAADMMIARRADTRARADFATWKMMAKLNGASALPAEAQTFLASYQALLKKMPEADQKQVAKIMDEVESEPKKQYVLKGVAAGHSVKELQDFAKKIQGKDAK